MKSMSGHVPHRTILQNPKVKGTTEQWMIQGSRTHQRRSALAQPCPRPAGPMQDGWAPPRLMRSCRSLGSLRVLWLQRPLHFPLSPGMLHTLVSVPNPSGWATSPEVPQPHSREDVCVTLFLSPSSPDTSSQALPGTCHQSALHILVLVADRTICSCIQQSFIIADHVPGPLPGTEDPGESNTAPALGTSQSDQEGRPRHGK